ncbi:MAG: TonB-dependent receptor plug domain-containing protein [Gemmatimonadota bacterium]|nr:TonB-dependent receptor plug domain-containing protein [Gemmatimonadota bacterium]
MSSSRAPGRRIALALSAIAIAASLPACRTMNPGPEHASNAPTNRMITEDQIERTGARSAWDLVRATVPFTSFSETRQGMPTRMRRRGKSSIYLNDDMRILLDGTPLEDITPLRDIPAFDIASIEVLSGIDATTRFGTNYGSGAVIIHTKVGTYAERDSTSS